MDKIVPAAAELWPGATVNKLEVVSVEEVAKLDIIAEGRIDYQLDVVGYDFDPFKVCSCIWFSQLQTSV